MYSAPALIPVVSADVILEWHRNGEAVLVDVREVEEYQSRHIDGAFNVPLSQFDISKLPTIPEGKRLVFHCQAGVRCGTAAAKAAQDGYGGEIIRMQDGLFGWMAAGGMLVR